VYNDNKDQDVENLELKLDEAILRETPKLEVGVNIIKIFAAIAPLMGLLGTVVGMIETFQQITLFGTGDPKIMAGSISMALVTTALGLIAALPLILVHAVVAGRSKSVLHILDEQSAGIIASHAEKEKA
jgi:biopolymer transport protein ExbB